MESFRGLAGDTWYACKRAESRSCTGYYEAIPIAGPPYQSPKFLAKKACQSDLSFNVCRSQLNYSLKNCMAEDWRNPSEDNKSMACNITSSVHNFPFTTLKNLKHTICRHFGIDEYMVVTIKSKIEGERGCGGESGRRFLRNSEQTLAENFQIDCSQYVTSRKNIKNLEYQKLRIPRSNK
jgi:hypothetical protein